MMYRTPNTYKNIFKDADENLKEIQDKIDCLQRSQVYLHNHISRVEFEVCEEIHDLKNLLLRRLMDLKSYDEVTALS
jgi:hypothetical protein